MRQEARVRARVWLLLAAITGAGSLYVNDRMERADDRRALRNAITALNRVAPAHVPPAIGGGPVETAPEPIVHEYAVGMAPAPVTIEEEPPAVEFVVERAVLADAGPPVAEASVATVEVASVVTVVESEPPTAKVASAVDAGILYDPNVPYVFPLFAAPIIPYEPASVIPLGFGAGGMLTPSTTMAGGTGFGLAGAAPVIGPTIGP